MQLLDVQLSEKWKSLTACRIFSVLFDDFVAKFQPEDENSYYIVWDEMSITHFVKQD